MLLAGPRGAFSADYAAEPVPASDSKKPFTFSFDLDFVSRYVWRGIAYSNGPVFQPSALISSHGFTFTVWNNIDLSGEPDRKPYNELDFYFTYNKTWKGLTFEPSFYVYYYPTQLFGPTTGEFSLKLSYPAGPIDFFTAQTVDLIAYPGAYFGEFGISYERDIVSQFSLATYISLGWANGKFNEAYLDLDKAAANVFTYNLEFRYYPLDFFFLRPHFQVTALLNRHLRSQVEDPTIVSGGMALGLEF